MAVQFDSPFDACVIYCYCVIISHVIFSSNHLVPVILTANQKERITVQNSSKEKRYEYNLSATSD